MSNMKWYGSTTSWGQGLIVEEGSGRSIAVTYKADSMPLIAAAPTLLAALESICNDAVLCEMDDCPHQAEGISWEAVMNARNAISAAKGV